MSTYTVYVPGPMEPDLFDGETPRMDPVQLHCWDAEFHWWIGDEDDVADSGSFVLSVAATTEAEAEQLLAIKAEGTRPPRSTVEMQWIEETGGMDPRLAEEYRQWRWLMHQNEHLLALRQAA